MRRFLMTIGCGLAMFVMASVASAQEKQAPYQKPVQAPTQKGDVMAPTQKGQMQAPMQKGHVSPHQAPTQKMSPVQGPYQKPIQSAMQKPTQKPIQKGGYSCNNCNSGRRFRRA